MLEKLWNKDPEELSSSPNNIEETDKTQDLNMIIDDDNYGVFRFEMGWFPSSPTAQIFVAIDWLIYIFILSMFGSFVSAQKNWKLIKNWRF